MLNVTDLLELLVPSEVTVDIVSPAVDAASEEFMTMSEAKSASISVFLVFNFDS